MAILVFSCSKSKEDVVKANIENWMKTNLNDPSSYEFISLGILIPDTSIDYNHEIFLDLEATIKQYEVDKNTVYGDAELNRLTQRVVVAEKEYIDSVQIEWKKYQQERKINKGYVIHHVFRAKNAMGALMIHEYDFVLNPDLSVLSAKSAE